MKTDKGFGDGSKLRIQFNQNEVEKLLKKYRNIKKYMRSPIYEIKKIDGTEKVISDLLKDQDS